MQAVVERCVIADGLVHGYAQDGNGDAHLKAALVGPSVGPVEGGPSVELPVQGDGFAYFDGTLVIPRYEAVHAVPCHCHRL